MNRLLINLGHIAASKHYGRHWAPISYTILKYKICPNNNNTQMRRIIKISIHANEINNHFILNEAINSYSLAHVHLYL